MENLENIIKTANEKIETLENETIVNKRIKLMGEAQEYPLKEEWSETTYGIKDVTLNDSIKNYKYLEIQLDSVDDNVYNNPSTMFLATEQISFYASNNMNDWSKPIRLLNIDQYVYKVIFVWFKDDKTLCISNVARTNKTEPGKMRIKAIYGIK